MVLSLLIQIQDMFKKKTAKFLGIGNIYFLVLYYQYCIRISFIRGDGIITQIRRNVFFSATNSSRPESSLTWLLTQW